MKSLLLASALTFLAACGSSTVPDTVAPSDVSPDCQYKVVRHDPNGWLLNDPLIHLDFWGGWADGTPQSIYHDWKKLLDEDGVLTRLSEYGVHEGTLDSSWTINIGSTTFANDGGADDDAGTRILEDSSFVGVINDEIQNGQLPYPSDNTLYVVVLPTSISTTSLIDNGWGAYHSSSNYAGQRYAYAIIRWNNSLVYTSHEIYEACTNPGNTGWWDTASGNEIGDLCEGANDGENIGGYYVQRVWSQTLCQCQ